MRLLALFVGIILFQIMFFQEKMGINVLFFNVFVIVVHYFTHFKTKSLRDSWQWLRIELKTSFALLFMMSIVILWHNSLFSKIMWWILLFVTIGLQIPTIRLTFNAFIQAIIGILLSPIALAKANLSSEVADMTVVHKRLSWLRYSGMALLIVPIFFGIYYIANDDFATLVDRFWVYFTNIFGSVHIELNPERIFWFWFGGAIMTTLLLPLLSLGFTESTRIDTLQRINATVRRLSMSGQHYQKLNFFNMVALRSEYRMAIIVFAALNALLLFINCLDIRSLWFRTIASRGASELSKSVHDGTFMLIFSIGLAILVVGYFFRGNLNFYTQNQNIIRLTKIWLLQNVFLSVTLLIRNIQYIYDLGLAYKRIGVLIFLLLIIVGLWSVAQKVLHQKTLYYLFRVNSWSLLFIFTFAAVIDWDCVITNYNINRTTQLSSVDFDFLTNQMSSNKNLPMLWSYRKIMNPNDRANLAYQLHTYKTINTLTPPSFWSYNFNDAALRKFFIKDSTEIQQFYKQYESGSPYQIYN